jgi:hypothetical protein
MEHGCANGPAGNKDDEHQETGGYSDERYEYNGKEWTTEDEDTCSVAISEISCERLNEIGQEAVYPRDQAGLCQGEGEFVHEDGKKGADKGNIEIPDKMDERKGKDDFDINGFSLFRHKIKKAGSAKRRLESIPAVG